MHLTTEITDHKGRLLREILEGQLYLVGTGLVRYNFSFTVGDRPVGIYGIRSYGKKKVRAIRAWNNAKDTRDPVSGLYVPTPGRQFGRINAETPLFLVEFDQGFTRVVDKIAFRAGKVRVKDAEIPSTQPELRFEEIDLEELEVLG